MSIDTLLILLDMEKDQFSSVSILFSNTPVTDIRSSWYWLPMRKV